MFRSFFFIIANLLQKYNSAENKFHIFVIKGVKTLFLQTKKAEQLGKINRYKRIICNYCPLRFYAECCKIFIIT